MYDVATTENIVKKIRVSLKKDRKSWSFVLFDSAESAFYLKDEKLTESDDEYYRIITLEPSDLIEVEWLGTELVYSDEYETDPTKPMKLHHEKFDKVRLGKLTPIVTRGHKTGYVELHSGWVVGDTFKWTSDEKQDDLKITRIKGKAVSKLDFEKLFFGRSQTEEEKDFEESFAPSELPN